MMRLISMMLLGLVACTAIAQDAVERPNGEPRLRAEDDRAIVEAWFDLRDDRLDLMGRFEAVLEIRADGEVRVENWSIDEALGDELLITVVDEVPLSRDGELGDWFGRYRVVVEPLVDGTLTLGPLELAYLVDPDTEADPTQLEPVRTRIVSDSIPLTVAGPDRPIAAEPSPAKPAAAPDREFGWRMLLIIGASVGVVAPILMALVLAVRTTKRRTRDEAPQRCIEQLDALERVVRAAGPSGLDIDGAAVASEVMDAIRQMFDASLGLDTLAMSGPEMLKDGSVRAILSADAFDHLRGLVEQTEAVRFAGAGLSQAEAQQVVERGRQIARAVERQRRGRA